MRSGQIIDGRYEIVRHIGSGGMANVYLAFDPILERDVAIKFLRMSDGDESDSIRRFQREAASISELNHPNIVSVYDIGDDEAGKFIAMEFVDGLDLKQYIKKYHPIPIVEVRDIMLQILSGVQSAHERGIIHRDLKPQNIMVKNDGRVKIMDFGIAIVNTETSITQTNTIIGSVHYLSPEQARGSLATPKSDIYSLGIVLFEMLTGRVPFDGESAVSIALKHFQESLPPIEAYRDDVPLPLRNVIAKATAKDASDRYIDCAAMQADIKTVLDASRRHEPIYVPGEVDKDTMVLAKEDIQLQLQNTDEKQLLAAGSAANTPVGASRVKKASLAAGAANISKQKTDEEAVPVEVAEQVNEATTNNDFLVPNKGVTIKQTTSEQLQRRNRRLIIIFILLLLALGSAIIYSMNRNQTVEIPNVHNMSQEEATLTLQQFGFEVGDIVEEHNDETDAGLVFDTDPRVGNRVTPDTDIDLFVSLGLEPLDMANYVGQTYSQAAQELISLGFEVERLDEYSEDIPENEVISQSIAEGESVIPAENVVTLTVSAGQESFEMPDMTNWTRDQVEAFADEAGLTVNFSSESSDTVTEGQVISQSIRSGDSYVSGDNLDVVLSTGPETVTFTYTVPIEFEEPDEGEGSSSSSSSSSSASSSTSSSNSSTRSSSSSASSSSESSSSRESSQARSSQVESRATAMLSDVWQESATRISKWWQDGNDLANLTAGLPINTVELDGENTQIIGLQDILNRGENQIVIYIEDLNHNINEPAEIFTITEDIEHTMEFETEIGGTARFRIIRNGEEIMENRVTANE